MPWGSAASRRDGCCLPVGPGDIAALPLCPGTLDRWRLPATTHQPADCTGYRKVHQQGSLVETLSCNYVGTDIWLQEECNGEPLRECLNVRNSKSFVSGGISHPLDAGQLSSEIDLLPDGGRTETFAVSRAGWGLTAHSCLSWFP